ncbi:putative F-box protein At3g17270 isoform X1 [Cornus florida]|uniref:putative F-box protein At3g17270 isoform X1 n=1 Tax=Cornus florida TaxID=4283 RepID=UPI0028986421|nr:putative F-box protein At3g17270 isoform X1 [Cornus florida]
MFRLEVTNYYMNARAKRKEDESRWLRSSRYGVTYDPLVGTPESFSVKRPPDEIADDILLRLPVRSIIQFKSVCKPWYSLFSNPKFIKAHLYRAIMNNSGYFILKHPFISEEEMNFYGIQVRSGLEIFTIASYEDVRK